MLYYFQFWIISKASWIAWFLIFPTSGIRLWCFSSSPSAKVGGWRALLRCDVLLVKWWLPKKNVQVLSVCKWGQVVLAKDESWGSFLGVKSHDSPAGINFCQLGKMAEPPIACWIEDEVKILEALPLRLLCQWCSSPGGWPKQLQEDLHQTVCGPQIFTRTLLSARVSRKDDAFIPNQFICHVQKDVGSHDGLRCMNTDVVKFLRPNFTKRLRDSDAQRHRSILWGQMFSSFFSLQRAEWWRLPMTTHDCLEAQVLI